MTTSDIIPTNPPQIAGVTIHVTCPCGEPLHHEVDCENDDSGTWSVALHDQFILCETCDTVLDVGLRVTVGGVNP